MSRKLVGYLAAIGTLIYFSRFGAPGEAYTALGLIATTYIAGQSAVDTWGRGKPQGPGSTGEAGSPSAYESR